MKDLIRQLVVEAIFNANEAGLLLLSSTLLNNLDVEIEASYNPKHGDFSTNLALKLSKEQKILPIKIAQIIVNKIKDNTNLIKKVEIAPPGFINFYIKLTAWYSILESIHALDYKYGYCNIGCRKKVLIEFVSSNPTGPLHIGHGRGAAIGDSMANILAACGFDVKREYYVNDSGKQIATLGLSLYLRIKAILSNSTVNFPENCYQGNYIKILAKEFIQKENIQIKNLEYEKDQIINKCAKYASKKIIDQIRDDLNKFGVNFDCWFSEKSLYYKNKVENVINKYRKKGLIYEQDGAYWFKTSDFGDEKDRVVIRKNGMTTYFASDIAYHEDKFDRGFEKIIDVWGADHHGYVPRIKALIQASNRDKEQFKVILVKLVNLLRDNSPVPMSTRKGEFKSLNEIIDEVGVDAARFLFLTRHHESPLNFDIEIAKKKSVDNPVYYVQYVYARITNVLDKGGKKINDILCCNRLKALEIITYEELEIIKKMAQYPTVVKTACQLMEPHRISFYLINLASDFHAYYTKNRILTDDLGLTNWRLYLISAVKKVVRNGLQLLGISTPDKM